jgi:hypothetical protein
MEVNYLFPIDPEAAISKIVIQIDDRLVEAKIMEKQKA